MLKTTEASLIALQLLQKEYLITITTLPCI